MKELIGVFENLALSKAESLRTGLIEKPRAHDVFLWKLQFKVLSDGF